MRFAVLFLTSMMSVILISCTNGEPSLSMLSSFNGITFSSEKKTTETYTIGTAPNCLSDLKITGQCDQRFDQLQFSIDNEATWTRMTGYNTDSDGNCSDGEFKLYFPNACTTFGISDGGNEIKKILIRGEKNIAQNTTREASVKFTSDVINATRISIASSGGLVSEGSVSVFTVTLSLAKAKPVTVDYAVDFGSGGITASDFNGGTSGTLTFAPNETTKTISLSTKDNSTVCEVNKPFSVILSNPSTNAVIAIAQASTAIIDPDRPGIRFVDSNSGNAGIAEGTEGSTISVGISLSAVCPTQDIKFDWRTNNATAIAPGDYTSIVNTTATIVKGQTGINLNISTNQDLTIEGSEYFAVELSNPMEGSFDSGNSANVYILDDDLPIASINSVTALESSNLTFTVSLSSVALSTVIVYYSFAHGTTNAADFMSAPASTGFVTILAGATTANITLNVFNDVIDEPDQEFTLTLEPTGTVGATISVSNFVGTGKITDDDAEPTLSILVNTSTISESAANAVFTITPSQLSEKLITVKFSTVDATAIHTEDFTEITNQTINIPANTASVTQNVAIINDTIDEPRQYFSAQITSPTNATLGGVTIVSQYLTDNDAEPTVAVIATSGAEGSIIPVEVRLSAPSQQTFSVNYASALLTASGGDFSAFPNSGTINFPINTTSQYINFSTVDDTDIESSETFTVTISNPQNTFTLADASGNISIDASTATITITDNDGLTAPTLAMYIPSVSPGISARPILRASGVAATEDLILYADFSCSAQVGIATASGTTVDVSPSTDLTAGSYIFYAKRKSGSYYSPCSSGGVIYIYAPPVVTATYPTNGANWNDYVTYSNSALKPYNLPDSACSGSETGYTDQYTGCVHGGEKRKVELTGFSSCASLTMTESLGAFDWVCDNVSGVATFYTRGLKLGMGLRDLVDTSSATWKNNSVTISYAGTQIATTASTAWWTNPITKLTGTFKNDNTTSVVNLNDAGRIYFASGTQNTFGYAITADKVSLFTAAGAHLSKYEPTDSNNCSSASGEWNNSVSDDIDTVICVGNRKYLWIEANLQGDNSTYKASYGLYTINMKRSHMRSMVVKGYTHDGFYSAVKLYNSHSNFVQGLTIHDAGGGLLLQTSSNNLIKNINVSNTYTTSGGSLSAIEINGASAEFNKIVNIRISNHGKDSVNSAALEIKAPRNIISKAIITNTMGSAYNYGIHFGGSTASENIVSQVVISGASHGGVIFDSAPSNNILNSFTITNVVMGVYLFGGSPLNNSFTSFVIQNVNYGFYSESSVPTGPLNNQLADFYVANQSSGAFQFHNAGFGSGAGYILYDSSNSCGVNYGLTFCSDYSALGVPGLASGGYVGPISVDDTANPDDSLGSANFSSLSIDGMLKFDTISRGWGRDYAIGTASAIGSTDSVLRIWDFSVVSGGRLDNRSGTGITSNSTLTLSGADCASSSVNSSHKTTSTLATYYRNAIEIEGDGIGNDNELCESGESCYYLPNIGGAQPSGGFSASYCTVDSTVKLYTRGN